jgi:Cohesin domain
MYKLFGLVVVLFGFAVLVAPVSAATLKVDSEFSALHVGDVFTVDLSVDTERETLNAIEASVVFPTELLEYIASDDSESVISLFVAKPTYADNQVSFSGITPGGFSDSGARLLTLTFKVIGVGQGNIEINEAAALLHDGLGTEARLSKQNLHLAISEGQSSIVVNTVDDEIPEAFTPQIIQDPDVFAGSHTLIFATEDKGSGLDYYLVKEGYFSRYHVATSPYELQNQALDKKITIKAVDRLKNERVEILYPQNWRPLSKHPGVIISIITICALSLFVLFRRFRARRAR